MQPLLKAVIADEHQLVLKLQVGHEFADDSVEFAVGPLLQRWSVVANVVDKAEPARVSKDELVASAPVDYLLMTACSGCMAGVHRCRNCSALPNFGNIVIFVSETNNEWA